MIKLIVFLPLIAAISVGLNTKTIADSLAQAMTSGFLLISAVFSGIVFYKVALLGEVANVVLMPWINSGDFQVNWALKVDVLTAVMLVVVTWVSAVVHLYSIGYMSHDEHKPRFMAYLSLFTFCMLMLVTSDNFVQLFFGWEGVGLSSYLLIGFWYKKDSANAASMKAFLVNRVGDVGLAMGIALIYLTFNTVNFAEVFAQTPAHAQEHFVFLGYNWLLLDAICLLLFIGCMGKSAQLLLHTWLPDAMEGPTPVSALIHAATMVTAGVFLVARCSPMFDLAPLALQVVTIVGACTAFFAATVGLVQNDIKRVIAYSTCSQLGYMFFACGVSAYSAGVEHLMTHAFFKALLFLGAGSVIHAMSGEQDMRKMGGIWKKIPFTYAYIWIGSLALAGVPPFAGFFSKDMILEAAFASKNSAAHFAFYMGIAAAFMTAFYSWRLIFMTFHGKSRASHEVQHHVHESPAIMLVPLLLLAFGAVSAGYIDANIFGMTNPDGNFWRGALFVGQSKEVLEAAHHVPEWVKELPLIVGALGIFMAWVMYIRCPDMPAKIAKMFATAYRFLLNKWYFDELYNLIFVRSAQKLGNIFYKLGDIAIIDGLGPNGFAALSLRGGVATGKTQTGYLNHYALVMMAGLLLLLVWLGYNCWSLIF